MNYFRAVLYKNFLVIIPIKKERKKKKQITAIDANDKSPDEK